MSPSPSAYIAGMKTRKNAARTPAAKCGCLIRLLCVGAVFGTGRMMMRLVVGLREGGMGGVAEEGWAAGVN